MKVFHASSGANYKFKRGSDIMPRRARKDLHTSFFHVIVQGVNKEYIFENNKLKERYLQILKQTER